MDLLKQCQQWFEQDEAQKVIDTLEAIPAEERTPELDSELAKAYIAVAHIGEREPFEKALELLAPHEEYFAEDHCWNYRIALAYYCLDEEGPALRYFEKALKARPGDKDTQEYINDCRRRLSLPRFEKNFRERTQEAWAAFSQIEAELRQIIDTDETHQRGEELVEKCGNALKTALRDTSFELGFNGEKHELILSPEGLRSRLFPLVYFQKQAPESVLEHWNIWVGRQPCEGFELRAGEIEVRAEDVQMWAEETEDHQVSLVLYCEKLTPILKEDTDKVWWALSMLVDQTIGEVSAIAFVAGFDVYAQPKDEPAKLLSELPELLQSMGLSLWRDGSDYLENSYLAYELEPVEDPEADWRLDVYTGSCRLPVLINDYLTARSDMVDEYHKDGIAAGFLLYPLSGFTGEERVKAILDFRDNLRDAILRDAGEEAVTFLGGATGLYCGYLDFIAWDLPAVLTAAQAFFEGSDLPYAHFHAFRRDVGGVPLLDEKEPEPDIHEETGSLLSTEDIEILESFDEGTAAYFGKMLDWLENFIKSGVEEGRFSEKQAHQDLQIALWYAFACLNLDDYIHYGEADSPYFPSDIDNYALEYFGSEQYYSDKFQDEAYLFIPFDENYYQAMAKVMEKRFANWQGQSFDEATLEPSDLAEAMMEYLDCECTYFPSMTDDDPIMSAYNYAKRESVKEGFVPVLIKADDEILWECLIMNSDPDSDGEDDFAFDPDKVAEYRKKMLSAPVENSKAVLEEMIGQRKEEAEDDDMDWDEEILGEMEGGYDNRRFSSYWNSDNNMTYPLILAKIPVKNPWEIFAYLPFGGWNECPNTPELMAVAKYWFEQHGAVPAAMSHDELEFLLPAPVPEEKAMDAAVELYGFCPDVIDQGPEDATVGALADVLRQSTVWYFWWD